MRKLHRIIALVIIPSMVLTGCWDQKIFEKVGLAMTSGIEESPDGKLLINYVFPAVGAQESKAVNISMDEGTLARGARENARLSSPYIVEGDKIQQILISESLTRKGIHDILEIYQRDVSLPAIAYVVVVEGSPYELLQKASEFKNQPVIFLYLFQLLNNNAELSNIPNTKVFDFDINFFAPGLDPIVPMIKLGQKEVDITGSALFSKDKMVGKLDDVETLYLIAMMDQAENAEYIIEDPRLASDVPNKYGISISLHRPKRKVAFDFNEEGMPIIDISMKYQCVLDEYKWNKTNDPKEQERLEGIITEYLKKEFNDTMDIVQKANSDPIGLGDMIRAKYHDYWQSINWDEVYPEAEINVDMEIEIIREGLIK